MKTLHTKLALTSILLSTTLLGYGWGQKGHDTVAAVANRHLTDSVRARAERLLDNRSIIYWSNWMDNASNTPEYAYTKTWHYKNIDAGVAYADAEPNPKGDIVRALDTQIAVLADTTASDTERSTALKMVVHFMGDIHQPMHIGHASDRGGNSVKVKFFNSPTNLHSLWDTKLVESAHRWSHTEWAEELDRVTPQEAAYILSLTTPDEWARETMAVTTSIYGTTPTEENLSYDYVSTWTPVIEVQFLRGGLRLAEVLNKALGY